VAEPADLGDVAGAILTGAARGAALNAHAPYSRFAVGAAVLLSDGAIVTGANLENASYGLSLCAETVAIAAASAQGRLADIVAIGVAGGKLRAGALTGTEVVRPCGRCRQILNEAAQTGGLDIAVHCASGDGKTVERHMLSTLLPYAFGPDDLS
jgi:cytidine deaminase